MYGQMCSDIFPKRKGHISHAQIFMKRVVIYKS